MRQTLAQIINWLLLAALAGCSWLLPRRLGFLGILASQALVAIGFIGMGGIALATGLWDKYDGPLNVLGLLVQAFVFNLLLLAVGCVAAWRRRSARSCWNGVRA